MRSLLTLALLLTSLASLRATDAKITSVWAEWRNAKAFDRISEYFGGSESDLGHHILRTHAEARAGFYFLLRLDGAAVPADAKFELQVIRPDSPEPRSFTFPASASVKNSVFELGLTGADWPGASATHPVAWRVALLAGDGHVLSEQKSFLWENPAK